MLFVAANPDVRLRDLADALEVTERTAYSIVVDLTDAGYLVKRRDGRRNRYEIQEHLALHDSIGRRPTIGDVLDLLLDAEVRSGEGRPDRRADDGTVGT